MTSLPKRKYAPEFRAEAVKLVESGVAQAEVARRLGVAITTLSGWCELGRKGALNAGERKPASDKDQEIARLKRENAELRMERDILRKAAAYFAKESR
jgi:transposase